MDGNLSIVPAEAFSAAAAELLAGALEDAPESEGGYSFVLAGGSTPRRVYRRLAEASGVDWDSVRVFFGDERAVPSHDPRSNYRMARESLLERIDIPDGQVHRIEAEREDLEGAAAEYASELPGVMDLVVLGIGEDGHTASLFPGSPVLDETVRRVVAIEDAPQPPARRITLTAPTLRAAGSLVVLASGERKADAVHRALEEEIDVRDCPARIARSGTWVLDREAASGLSRPGRGQLDEENPP